MQDLQSRLAAQEALLRDLQAQLNKKDEEIAKAKKENEEKEIARLKKEKAEMLEEKERVERELRALQKEKDKQQENQQVQAKMHESLPPIVPTSNRSTESGLSSSANSAGTAAAATKQYNVDANAEAPADGTRTSGKGANLSLTGSRFANEAAPAYVQTMEAFRAGEFQDGATPVYIEDKASGKYLKCELNLAKKKEKDIEKKYECNPTDKEEVERAIQDILGKSDEVAIEASEPPTEEVAPPAEAEEPVDQESLLRWKEAQELLNKNAQ